MIELFSPQLASATQAELEDSRDRIRDNLSSRAGSNQATPSPTPASDARSRQQKRITFNAVFQQNRYPPAIWAEEYDEDDDDDEWNVGTYELHDPRLLDDGEHLGSALNAQAPNSPSSATEPDDDMSWEDGAVQEASAQAQNQVVIDVAPGLNQQQISASPEEEHSLRSQSSRQRLDVLAQEEPRSSPTKAALDPEHAMETRKLSMTPPVARVEDTQTASQLSTSSSTGPLLPSQVMQKQTEERKRTRQEIEALEEAARKKVSTGRGAASSPAPEQFASRSGPSKLRKERDAISSTDDENGKEKDKKKKSGGVFGFLRKKDKEKDKGKLDTGSTVSISSETNLSRESGDSSQSITQSQSATMSLSSLESNSPTTVTARQQQQQVQQQQQEQARAAMISQVQASPGSQQARSQESNAQSVTSSPLSQQAQQLRQRDQQQQALYQQYLNRSPSTPPEAQPSYGLQSASAVLQGSTSFSSSTSSNSGLGVETRRPRPGSLILSPTAINGQGAGLPDLNVVRVFAGDNLQTDATFKTVLLSSSTTASDLVRQAIQRFRLPAGEDENEYYLTIKQVEGSTTDLRPDEKPLGVFESLVEAVMELPKINRNSVGSISSVASNLSMHPAIRKLPMNDFTDDSAVKFYLNRKSSDKDDSFLDENDDTMLAESDHDDESSRSQYLSVPTAGIKGVPAERFSSPSYRFALQLVVHPDDLPDNMVFDSLTEAIVFKDTLRDRSRSSAASSSSGISQTRRTKVFVFPKNITVAEVIELGLERFGILEGVVDGGDEIEDKLTKRRSSTRVRYGLTVEVGGKGECKSFCSVYNCLPRCLVERELSPSSKVIEAFPRPPVYRAVERQGKRRSVDSAQLLLGSFEDVQPDDPLFILRRAVAYRSSTSRHKGAAPLDEIALQQKHRDSVASSSGGSDSTAGPAEKSEQRQMSKQEVIAAQRAASRANQRAILSAQANSDRGLDLLLPGNAMIRSSRYEIDDRMRYSYVEPDGETYDISDIVEEEWREGRVSSQKMDVSEDDLLHDVLTRGKDGLGAKLDRVLNKVRHEKETGRVPVAQSVSASTMESFNSMQSSSSSAYSGEDFADATGSRTATPTVNVNNVRPTASAASPRTTSSLSRLSSYRTASPGESTDYHRSGTSTPVAKPMPAHERNMSMASALSDTSYRSGTPSSGLHRNAKPLKETPPLTLPKEDFGLTQMMAVIEARSPLQKAPETPLHDPVDEILFGKQLDLNTLHPDIGNIYSESFKQLEEMDKVYSFSLFIF